jgi:hypothetical protein
MTAFSSASSRAPFAFAEQIRRKSLTNDANACKLRRVTIVEKFRGDFGDIPPHADRICGG